MAYRRALLLLSALGAFATSARAQHYPNAQLGAVKAGSLTVSGSIIASLNDISAAPDNSISSKIPYGNTAAKGTDYSYRAGPQASLLGTKAFIRNTIGSGTFGPGAADYAGLFSATKAGWDTSTGANAIEGELDPIISLARQGKKGDVSGIDIDVMKWRDAQASIAADETGSAIGAEIRVALQNSGGVYQDVHFIPGFLESIGGVSAGGGYGAWAGAFTGNTFSGFHAQERGGLFQCYFSGSTGNTPASINYCVDDTARMSGRVVNVQLATPASSSATCRQGDMTADTSYVYVCVATNTWKRSALSVW